MAPDVSLSSSSPGAEASGSALLSSSSRALSELTSAASPRFFSYVVLVIELVPFTELLWS